MSTDIKTSKKFIIGGGITGLVWKFYHPEYEIISPDIGGMYARTYMVWLHDTAETRKLLVDLGWKNPELLAKKSYIGYMADGWIADYQTEWLNQKIIERKMTPWNEKPDPSFIPKTRDLSMTVAGSYNYMNTLNVDLSDIIDRLGKKADILNGLVKEITPTRIVYSTEDIEVSEPYESIISTMAAPLFWKAYGKPQEFKSVPITNIIVGKKPEMFDDEYEMVYYTPDFPFSRISHIQGKWAIEFTGVITQEEFEKMYPSLPVVDYFVVKHGRIWEKDNIEPQDNIVFSGRFSQWKHGIVTENVIKQSIEHHEKSNTKTE